MIFSALVEQIEPRNYDSKYDGAEISDSYSETIFVNSFLLSKHPCKWQKIVITSIVIFSNTTLLREVMSLPRVIAAKYYDVR